MLDIYMEDLLNITTVVVMLLIDFQASTILCKLRFYMQYQRFVMLQAKFDSESISSCLLENFINFIISVCGTKIIFLP